METLHQGTCFDYSWLEGRIVYSDEEYTAMRGQCTVCGTRFATSSWTKKAAIDNLRGRYRNHKFRDETGHVVPCIAGVKHVQSSDDRRRLARERWKERKAAGDNAKKK